MARSIDHRARRRARSPPASIDPLARLGSGQKGRTAGQLRSIPSSARTSIPSTQLGGKGRPSSNRSTEKERASAVDFLTATRMAPIRTLRSSAGRCTATER